MRYVNAVKLNVFVKNKLKAYEYILTFILKRYLLEILIFNNSRCQMLYTFFY